MRKKIAVIGSSNVDFIMKLSRLPRTAETITDGTFLQAFGGKGANTAVAVARAGGDTLFLGCLGEDVYAGQVLENLKADGVDPSRTFVDQGVATGAALIMLNDKGENYLAVAPGSNYRLTPERIRANADLIESAAMVLLQMEVPIETSNEILAIAGEKGTPVLFNYAPARGLEVPVGKAMTILAVNEIEAGALAGKDVKDADAAMAAAADLKGRGPEVVIVTLGAEGSVVVAEGVREVVPAFKVAAVDTTAAGDTFCGAFAVARVEGKSTPEAIRFANAAAALSVTRMGAQPSIPKRSEIEAFLKERG